MATECGQSKSPGNVSPLTEDEKEMSKEQSLVEIKRWIESKPGLYGRSDEDFLLLFLQSCGFDLQLTKTTLIRYYESRRDIPQWWANRNVNDEITQSVLKLKAMTALIEGDIHQPTVIITRHSRFSTDLTNMDDYVKFEVIALETVLRRSNSQRNGIVWIVDFKDYKGWVTWYYLNPSFGKTFAHSFIDAIPVKMAAIIAINVPLLATAIIRVINPFMPQSVKGRIHVYGYDWSSKVSEHLPLEVLPEEYSGQGGPMKHHEDAFVEELMAFNDYIVDDNKYGFH